MRKSNEFNSNIKSRIKVSKISSIIIASYLILVLCYIENIYDPKQQIFKQESEYLNNPKIAPNKHDLGFWLNNDDIILSFSLGCENESVSEGRSYFEANIDISHCFFSRSSSFSGAGGVIYVSASSYSMNVNYSMFYNCVCSSGGGAIYYKSSNSYLRMICANRCSCGTNCAGHFADLYATEVNQVEYLSLLCCSYTTSEQYPIRLRYGDQRVDNINNSMNNAEYYSSMGIESPSSFTSSHCAFSNNKVSKRVCIIIKSSSGTISMSYAAIVHNNSPSSYGVVYVSGAGSKKMMYCIFQNNQNNLFCVQSGSLEVSHSFIYHSSSSFYTSITVSTSNNNSLTYRITYQIQFYNSFHCNADIPFLESTQFNSHTQIQTNVFQVLYHVAIIIIS